MSFRYYVRSCLDTAHSLFLSCRGHSLARSLIECPDHLVRVAVVCAWCWCRSWRTLLSQAGSNVSTSPLN